MIALVDMDGTLCNYEGELEAQLFNLLGVSVSPHDKKYTKLVDLIKRQDGFWRNLPPLPVGFTILDFLKDAGFDIHILTKGPYRTTSAWTEKVEWCRRYLPGTPVTITENKGMVYGRILVDDWPSYCESWLQFRPRGLVLMPAYDYNEGFDSKYPGQVVRVTSTNWKEVKSAIDRAANRLSGEPL